MKLIKHIFAIAFVLALAACGQEQPTASKAPAAPAVTAAPAPASQPAASAAPVSAADQEKLDVLKRLNVADGAKSVTTGESCRDLCLQADNAVMCEAVLGSKKHQCRNDKIYDSSKGLRTPN